MRTDQAVVADGCYPYYPYKIDDGQAQASDDATVQKLRAVA